MKTNKTPKLTLVGGGPGDPELITLKGLNAIRNADAILYDALVNEELLQYAKPAILKISVGKRKNNHSYTQDQINSLIIDLAFTEGHVVRLKGGDPFVFGRGQEELKYAELFNIETDFVPGISSALAVPALAGIPVTLRGVSNAFHVLTGTGETGGIPQELKDAARLQGTVVILMGVGNLEEITKIFRKAGKGNTPIALIQNGSLPTERSVAGTMNTIVKRTAMEKLKTPAVIVIGEVVRQLPAFIQSNQNFKYLLN